MAGALGQAARTMVMTVSSLLMVSPTRSTLHVIGELATTRSSSACFAVMLRRGRRDLAIPAKSYKESRGHNLRGGGTHISPLSACSMKANENEPYDPPNINRMQTDDRYMSSRWCTGDAKMKPCQSP